jgi:hypothetical protein
MNSTYTLQHGVPVSARSAEVRAAFVTRTYMHLLGAIAGFAAIEMYLLQSGLAATIAKTMFSVSWLLILGAFVVVGWLATRTAHNTQSLAAQYGALALYVIVEAIIFVPLLFVAEFRAPASFKAPHLLRCSASPALPPSSLHAQGFFLLGGVLKWGGIVAPVLIVAGVFSVSSSGRSSRWR